MNILSKSDKANLVKSKLISLGDKVGLSYLKEELVPPSKLLGEQYRFWFSGVKGIEIRVTFGPRTESNDYFTVFIFNRNLGDDFSLNDWLKINGGKNTIESFRLLSYSGSFEEKLDGFMIYLESIFSMPNMADILSGKKWEDVPFDWGDMK